MHSAMIGLPAGTCFGKGFDTCLKDIMVDLLAASDLYKL